MLRSPPDEYEQLGISENFYRWARRLQKRFAPHDANMAAMVAEMVSIKETIFPPIDAFGLVKRKPANMENVPIALRHGRTGIDTAMKYLGTGGELVEDKTDGLLPYSEVPLALSALLRRIRRDYSIETEMTKQFIRVFLLLLRSNYDIWQSGMKSAKNEPSESLRFAGQRVMSMVDLFLQSQSNN